MIGNQNAHPSSDKSSANIDVLQNLLKQFENTLLTQHRITDDAQATQTTSTTEQRQALAFANEWLISEAASYQSSSLLEVGLKLKLLRLLAVGSVIAPPETPEHDLIASIQEDIAGLMAKNL